MLEQISFAGNVVGLIGFSAAIAILLTVTPERPLQGWFSGATKWIFVASWGVYAYVTLADIAEELGFTGLIDYYEGYVEMLFPVLMLMGVYSAFTSQQIGDIQRSQRALRNSHDLMLGIVDAAPAGILFLDRTGAIAFANEMAKQALDLTEDEQGFFHAGWLEPQSISETFKPLMNPQPRSAERIEVAWPGGRLKTFTMSTEPLNLADGSFGGVVATFERPV